MYLERRALPRCSKITYKRQVEKDHKLHKDRLKSIKPSIDNKPPKKHPHLRRNLKREQMMEERFATIERENRILLSKMSDIMQKNTLDNHNESIQYSHSLNKDFRKRQLQRITEENQAILRRIQAREPVYNHFQWEEDRLAAEKYLSNIMEYPSVEWGSTAGGRRKFGGSMYAEGALPPMDEDYERSSRERAAGASTAPESFPAAGGRGGTLAPVGDPHRPAGGAGAGGSPNVAGRAMRSGGPEVDGRGGIESRGAITRGSEAGDIGGASLFSVGRKLGEDYFMISQSHAGEITMYNPFSSETVPLKLPAGFSKPTNLDEFRAMVNRVTRDGDVGFTLADHDTTGEA